MNYLPRLADALLERALRASGAVLVEGPKWCGKTTTSLQRAESVLYMQDPRQARRLRELAGIDIYRLLDGANPRLIDEWQVEPTLWDAVRFEVDRRGEDGLFILTGSATPVDRSEIRHSGTGRIARMRLRTMALCESGDSSGEVSLGALFDGAEVDAPTGALDLEGLAFLCCRGGWPASAGRRGTDALDRAMFYLESVVETELREAGGVRRNPDLVRAILRSYARGISTSLTEEAMLADVGGMRPGTTKPTLRSYLKALRDIYVLEDLSAWNPNLRSKAAIRQAPTRHFADPSIACAALGVGSGGLIADLETFGLVFEDLAVRDLRAIADVLGGRVYHYRDSAGLECDAVVQLRDGRYGLVDVKLGGQRAVEEAAASLLRLKGKIDEGRMGAPSFCLVLAGVNAGCYTRSDGVSVATIDRLGA